MLSKARASVVGAPLDTVWVPSTLVTCLDFALEIIPLFPGESSLKEDYLYQLLETGVGMLDPPGGSDATVIMPSFYNSTGSLVLGYNSSCDNVIYASADGILIPFSGNRLTYLNKSVSNPVDYIVCLNAVGGNASVPYNVRARDLFVYKILACNLLNLVRALEIFEANVWATGFLHVLLPAVAGR
jgi:hypothetical protein